MNIKSLAGDKDNLKSISEGMREGVYFPGVHPPCIPLGQSQ